MRHALQHEKGGIRTPFITREGWPSCPYQRRMAIMPHHATYPKQASGKRWKEECAKKRRALLLEPDEMPFTDRKDVYLRG